MPPFPPPERAQASPVPACLSAGTLLWRVHRQGRAAFEPKAQESDEVFGGGRFDSTGHDRYPYLYAAGEQDTALLETLVRGIPFDDRGWRRIRRANVTGQRLSPLLVTEDLTVISLMTVADLAAVYQDEWLIQAEPAAYPQTRRWAHWLRAQAAWAQGLMWPSRRNLGHPAMVLFGDRCPGGLAPAPGAAIDLDDTPGADWLNERLARYRVRLSPPRPVTNRAWLPAGTARIAPPGCPRDPRR
jgi:RES domain-containing protein